MEAHVQLAAEKLFSIGSFPVTNSLVTTWIVTLLLIAFAYFATRKIQAVPGFLQNIAESMVETFQDLVSSVAGEKTKNYIFYLLIKKNPNTPPPPLPFFFFFFFSHFFFFFFYFWGVWRIFGQ